MSSCVRFFAKPWDLRLDNQPLPPVSEERLVLFGDLLQGQSIEISTLFLWFILPSTLSDFYFHYC